MPRPSSLALALCLLGTQGLAAQKIPLPFPLKFLEETAVRDSNDAAAHYNVALAYWNEKRFDEAERSLRLSMTLDAQFAEPHLALSYLPYARRPKLWDEENDGKVPEAWKAAVAESDREYRRAFLINPFVDLRIIGAMLPKDQSSWRFDYPDLYELIQKPYDDLFRGNYGKAYEGFERLERKWGFAGRGRLPRHIHWFKMLCAARIGKIDRAMEGIDRLMKEAEEYEEDKKDELIRTQLRTNEYRYIKAILLQAQGRKDDAIALFRAVVEQDIGMYIAHVRMAALYEGSEQWTEAIAERQHAVNANPDDPSLLLDLGMTAAQGGQLDLALDALGRASEANPRLADAPLWIGLVHAARENREEAKQSLTRFLAIAPARWQGKIDLAKQRLGELESSASR